MPKDLIIIGASGHGKVVADIARQMTENGQKKYEEIKFLDDDREKKACGAYPVAGTTEDIGKLLGAEFIVAIGDAEIRRNLAKRLEALHADVPVLIHPKAIVGENVSIGKGTVVVGGAVINAGASIGEHCIINTGATVDHDCRISDYVHVAPGAHLCGGVCVGEAAWIGAGATVVQEVHIGGDCMLGAGSVVINHLDKAGTYMGIPAKQRDVKGMECY